MNEREQVISNLLYMKRDCLEGSDTDKTLDRAIALLKAQEPRVMTLEEVKRSAGETVWVERWGDSKTIVAQFAPYDTIDDSFYFFTIGNSVSYKVYTEDYYKDWRCWTSRPTDEQRRAAKWDE